MQLELVTALTPAHIVCLAKILNSSTAVDGGVRSVRRLNGESLRCMDTVDENSNDSYVQHLKSCTFSIAEKFASEWPS